MIGRLGAPSAVAAGGHQQATLSLDPGQWKMLRLKIRQSRSAGCL